MRTGYLIIVLIVLALISLFVGVKDLTPLDIISMDESSLQVFLISRLPRLIGVIVAGMGMSICGLIMQQITQNKFVSPTTAGTLDSAKLGILVVMIVIPGATTLTKMVMAFLFALAGSFLFMAILEKIKYRGFILVPLVGIMLGSVIDSITTFLAYHYDLIQNVNSWLEGSFSLVMKGRYELLYLSIPVLILSFLYANRFTIAGMGEDFAKNLGLNYKTVVNIGIAIVALVTAVVVITVGRIPFIGLIVPNIITLYRGDNVRENILPTGLFGAVFLLFCDILSRIVIYPYEVSISLTVGVLGSFIFLVLLFRRNAHAA